MSIGFKIKELIQQNGAITLDQMMGEVLSINLSSYYRQQDKLGSQGDFITAPETSQLFGEIIGLWSIDHWRKMGCPQNINLVELGPGRGLLMRDLLRVAKLVPEFYQSLTIGCIEINQHFIECQKANLANIALPINHHARIEDIAKIPTIIVANEFFDSMPIKQYVKVVLDNISLWYEATLTLDPNYGRIKFDKRGISKKLQNYLLQTHINATDGAIVEESPKSVEIIRFISNHIKQFGGASLIIDYGYDIEPIHRTRDQYNPTLQAIKNHQYYPLLKTLGEADLSAHVDFYRLKTVAQNIGLQIHDPISQRDFLIKNNILLRSTMLQNRLSKSQANIIERQVDRLISPTKMGLLFKILCLMKL